MALWANLPEGKNLTRNNKLQNKMSIKRTIIVTAAIAASVAMVAPTFAGAVTIDELLAQITALQGQLLALQGAPAGGSGTGACAGVTFTRNLTVGSTGSDVKCLQVLLNGNGFTVATTGAGSPGSETTYFGSKTLVAVKAFQASKGWTPANQVGPMTRQALNALIGGGNLPPIIPTGAGLTVQLASNNPVSGSVVDGQGMAPLTRLTFVNGDSSEVKVTSLKLKRIGISPDSTLTNVYLFDGSKRLTDSASVASTIVNFNDSTGLFTVPAMSSKTISVLSDVDGATGETIGVQVTAATDVTTNASSVKGNFPVVGNLFTLASGTSLATIYMADTTGTVTPAAADIDPQNDYAIWYDSAIVGTRAVDLQRVAFKVGGSVNRTSDIKNFRLLIDGVQKGSTVTQADANDYVTFDLTSAPVRLETGTRVVKVLADIIGGSNKNVYLSLRTAADMTAVDSQFGATLVLHRVDATTAFSVEDSGTQSIQSGTLTVTKLSTSPSGNVVDQANNVVLAKFEVKAAGERVKVESLRVSATINDVDVDELRNGAIYANGVQIGSTADIMEDSSSPAYTTYNFGSSLMVDPGSPVTLEVRADIYDSDSTNTSLSGNTIAINLESGDLNNAYGMTSLSTIDVPSTSTDVSGNTVTVATGGLVLSKYPAWTNQSVVAPLTASKLGHFTLSSGTTEAVNLTTLVVTLDKVSSYASNLYVKLGASTLATKASVSATNTWSINYALSAGQTVDAIVYGDVSSSMAGGITGVTGMYVNGTTSGSATSVCADTNASCTVGSESALAGQTLTYTSGSWSSALDGSSPLAGAVSGGKSVVVGRYKLTASNDSYTVQETEFTVANPTAANTAGVINYLVLKGPDGAVLATVPYDGTNGYYNITGLTFPVSANTSKVLTVELDLATPYTNGKATDGVTVAPTVNTTGKDVKLTLSYLKVMNSQGAVTTPTTSVASNAIYVYKTVPTFTAGALTNTISTGSSTNLYKFSVKADDKGPVALKQLKFSITITDGSAAGTETLGTFKLFRGDTDLTSSVSILNTNGDTVESTSTIGEGTSTIIVVFDTEEQVPASATYTYTLKGTPATFASSTSGKDQISTYLVGDSASTAGGTVNAQTKFFLDAAATAGIQTLNTTAGGTGGGTAYNIIWSDNSAQVHDYTYDDSSADWFNGFPMQSSDLDPIGIQVP